MLLCSTVWLKYIVNISDTRTCVFNILQAHYEDNGIIVQGDTLGPKVNRMP